MSSSSVRISKVSVALLTVSLIAFGSPLSVAQVLDDAMAKEFSWREVGPSTFGGRIVDIEWIPGERSSFLVASATGGLFKTKNNGTTWECLYQDEATIAIGDIAIDPQDPQIIWVGTGEANNQRSSYAGDGIYKSVDGGATWSHQGLKETNHIGRVVVHPSDSDVVYVAALGHLYTHNPERGLYRTQDGGKTWELCLFINDEVGIVDVAMDPQDPRVLYAASYERLRRAWHFDGAGPGSALYKTTDGGDTWKKLEGGLPEGEIGRIGVEVYAKDSKIVYATVSNQNMVQDEPRDEPTRLGFSGESGEKGFEIKGLVDDGPAAKAGLQVGDIVLAIAGEEITDVWSWLKSLGDLETGEKVEIRYSREGEKAKAEVALGEPPRPPRPRRVGGEIYRSDDAGATWTKQNERSIGGSPAYYYGQIRIDPNDDQRLYVLSVPVHHSEDGGKTWARGNLAGSVHVDHHALAINPDNSDHLLLGNDGGLAVSWDRGENWDHVNNLPLAQFYTVGVDLQEPYHIFGGTQDNGTWGGPSVSRSFRGIEFSEWYRVGGGDGFYTQVDPQNPWVIYGESQFGAIYRLDMKSWQSRSIRPPRPPQGEPPHRFNWSSPILISHHNPQIVYFGGNRLFKSFNRGDDWSVVSPDLTTADEDKIAGNVPHCTITTLDESPLDPNRVIVGTDDGLIQISHDGGLSWTNLAGRFPGVPTNWWVSRVQFSRHDRDTIYASFTGYREDDFRPFVFMSQNDGRSWKSISGNLPAEGSINVVREDPINPNLLFVGTDFTVFASLDRGATWTELSEGLPTTPVHDLVVHPRDHDLVIGTHGRGFFVADIGPLQEMTEENLAKPSHLFAVEDVTLWQPTRVTSLSGDRSFRGQNPPRGATISYYLKDGVSEEAFSLIVVDAKGQTIKTLEPNKEKGLHRLQWNLRRDRREGEGTRRGRRRGRVPSVPVGDYRVVMELGEERHEVEFSIRPDPVYSEPSTAVPVRR